MLDASASLMLLDQEPSCNWDQKSTRSWVFMHTLLWKHKFLGLGNSCQGLPTWPHFPKYIVPQLLERSVSAPSNALRTKQV